MCCDPVHSFINGGDSRSCSDHGTTDHVNLQAALPRGLDLGVSGAATGVLCEDALNVVRTEKRRIILRSKRAARGDNRCVRKAGRRGDRIDDADDVAMLRSRAKCGKRTPAQRRENSLRSFWKCRDRSLDARMLLPIITDRVDPCRTLDGEQRNAGFGNRSDRVVAHLRREGMRSVDQESNVFSPQIFGKANDAAEPAGASRQRTNGGMGSAAGKRQRRRDSGRARQSLGELCRFARASEQQNSQWSFAHRHHGASPMP